MTKVLFFPRTRASFDSLSRAAGLEEIFAHIESKPSTVILFVDRDRFCADYIQSASWIASKVQIVDADAEIVDSFQIDQVPCFQFFFNGHCVGVLVGTADEVDFQTFIEGIKEGIFEGQKAKSQKGQGHDSI
ncbi:MAG: hypothetical protein JNL01_03145 [Bdellovibrionales bacterium]|nr:hypothetical protein [Bdellovibrionales bacterium]